MKANGLLYDTSFLQLPTFASFRTRVSISETSSDFHREIKNVFTPSNLQYSLFLFFLETLRSLNIPLVTFEYYTYTYLGIGPRNSIFLSDFN